MKKPFTGLVLLLCSLFSYKSFAQVTTTKPAIFAAYPLNIILQESQLAQYFTKAEGATSDVALTPGFQFAGKVSSNIQKYPNLQSVVVRSSNFPGAVLQVSKITNQDNSISYSCHIISHEASDGYEMKPSGNGEYVLSKIQSFDILQDCNHN